MPTRQRIKRREKKRREEARREDKRRYKYIIYIYLYMELDSILITTPDWKILD
jgi:hypothetical protein